jgi:hypothetical protein
LRRSPLWQDSEIRGNPLKFFARFVKRRPYWLIALAIAGFTYAQINFTYFSSSLTGDPVIQNGQYVLQEHGQIIKTITEQEYHYYQANLLRLFSAAWIAFYGVALAALFPFQNKNPPKKHLSSLSSFVSIIF